MKILILGDAQHGKDTLADLIFAEHKLLCESSSMAALRIFLFDTLRLKYGLVYDSLEDAYEDRVNHRSKWFDEIKEYNREDKTRLAREILETSDIYIGMRSIDELKQAKKEGLFDLYLGVFDYRKPREDSSSNTIDVFEHSDIVLMNNTTIEDLYDRMLKINIL